MKATHQEMVSARRWLGRFEGDELSDLPFSFVYGGRPSAALLEGWIRQWASQELDRQRREHTLTLTDPDTGLRLHCLIVEYLDFPTVEWTLYFENTGADNTPILASIQALDACVLTDETPDGFVLHHHTGSPCAVDDYQPHRTSLHAPSKSWRGASSKRIAAKGGRPTNSDLPYFALEGAQQGVLVAVGWPGQWAAEFLHAEEDQLHVRAGQELTSFTLRPGEEVRSPLIVLQFWEGERLRAHNLWRRWMLAYNLPRSGSELPGPQLAVCNGNHFPQLLTNAEDEITFTERYVAEGVQVDYWWQDAGWYPNNGSWVNVGTWEVDRERFPGGLRAVGDRLRQHGIKTIVWFEPERVTPGTWLYEQHPEWLLDAAGETKLLNLGHREALLWAIEHFDRLLVDEGVDLYRQDFNIDPLPFWRANDAQDRQGITENYYVQGYLAFWDELRRRHPDMLIDSCASGGRRNDLETLRRSVPLLRSDLTFVPFSDQCQTYGLAFWLPYYGTGMINPDAEEMPYAFRSAMCPHFTAGWDVRLPDLDWPLIRRLTEQWRAIAHCYLGDYYPLTSYSLEQDVWMGWQFDRPDLKEGILQFFRRETSPYETARFRLFGLDAESRYVLTNLDDGEPQEFVGRELLGEGLPVTIKERPAAIVITYSQVG